MSTLSVIAVLTCIITTGLGIHVLRRPKHVVPDVTSENKDGIEWPDLSWMEE